MAYYGAVTFEWDAAKDEANQRKHGIGFAEACEIFAAGADYIEIFDTAHSTAEEERYMAIGPLKRGLVVVVWTERFEDVVRIVTARWATQGERRLFRRYMEGGGP